VRQCNARLMPLSVIILLAAFFVDIANGGDFTTTDPVNAFVHRKYPLGDDYFINGNKDTYIFRCLLTTQKNSFEGIALSEISIWGNRSGPWELFKKAENGIFVYLETRNLADTSCLERCGTKDYLASGECTWKRGWPKQ